MLYDLVLKGGLVVDGTRAKPRKANVCVKDGLIAAITEENVQGVQELDVTGQVVSPGFIDIHSHADDAPLVDYIVDSKASQGVTTELTGNCGEGILPTNPARWDEANDYIRTELNFNLNGICGACLDVNEYAERAQANGSPLNYGILVGHGNLRLACMGFVNRDPDEAEMKLLEDTLEEQLRQGAFGMSLGLIYPPSAFSSKDELVRLAKVVKKYDGIVSVHMRNEGPRVFEAVDEMIAIAEESGVHVQISHLKLMGKPQWGRSAELIRKIADARARGVHITCDQYPFNASSTGLAALVPNWAHEGGSAKMLERLADPTEELRRGIAENMENRGGAHTIMPINTHGHHPDWEGRFISDIAAELGMDTVSTVIKALLDCDVVVNSVYFCMSEQDVLQIMQQDFVCVGSDGYNNSYEQKYTNMNPHPRSFGTFPQFFETVREHNLMPLEDAVYKVTALPAAFAGLTNRGILKEGYAADITVFDAEKIKNRSTYVNSKVRPAGIGHVIVGGEVVYEHDALTGARPGKVLRHGH